MSIYITKAEEYRCAPLKIDRHCTSILFNKKKTREKEKNAAAATEILISAHPLDDARLLAEVFIMRDFFFLAICAAYKSQKSWRKRAN